MIELTGLRLLFDCGHGVLQRLFELGIHHNTLEHVVLSYFHPDHVSDHIPLLHLAAWSRRNPRVLNLNIYGPQGLQSFIDKMLNLFEPQSLQSSGYSIVIHEITDNSLQIGNHSFRFTSLPPAGNHGLHFIYNSNMFAITGDSYFHEAEVNFLRDAEIAVIDASHLIDAEIIQLAVASQARMIICSHLYREINIDSLQQRAQNAGYLGSLICGRDLISYQLY